MPDLPNTITFRECGLCLAILTGLIVLQATASLFGSMLATLCIIAITLGVGLISRSSEVGQED